RLRSFRPLCIRENCLKCPSHVPPVPSLAMFFVRAEAQPLRISQRTLPHVGENGVVPIPPGRKHTVMPVPAPVVRAVKNHLHWREDVAVRHPIPIFTYQFSVDLCPCLCAAIQADFCQFELLHSHESF